MTTKAKPVRKRKLRKTLFTRKPQKVPHYDSDDFQVGDFVFAKLRGHSHWPARIAEIQCGKYLVHFYGSLNIAFMRRTELFHYDKFRYEFCTLARLKMKKFRKAIVQINLAIKQYNAIAKLNGTNKYVNIVMKYDNVEDENDDDCNDDVDDENYEDLEISEVLGGEMTNNIDSKNNKHQIDENDRNYESNGSDMSIWNSKHGKNDKNIRKSKNYKNDQSIQKGESCKNNQSIPRSKSYKNDQSVQKSKSGKNDQSVQKGESFRNDQSVQKGESCKNNQSIPRSKSYKNDQSIQKSKSGKNDQSIQKDESYRNENSDSDSIGVILIRGSSSEDDNESCKSGLKSVSTHNSESVSTLTSESVSTHNSKSVSRNASESVSKYASESASRYASESVSSSASEIESRCVSEISRKTVLPTHRNKANESSLTEGEAKFLTKERDFLRLYNNLVCSLPLGKTPQLNMCLTQLRILNDFLIHIEPLMLVKNSNFISAIQSLCIYRPGDAYLQTLTERRKKIIFNKVEDIRRKAKEILPKLKKRFITNIPKGKTFEDIFKEEVKIFEEKTKNFSFLEKQLITLKKQYLNHI